MSPTIEDRLTTALAARAEQVRLDDLRPGDPSVTSSAKVAPRWRRPGTLLVAAAVVITLVGVPVAVGELTSGPGRVEPSAPTAHRVVADVDGDGALDVVTLSRSMRLRVHLQDGHGPRRRFLPHGSRLVGAADIGSRGIAVVVSEPSDEPDSQGQRQAVVYRLVGDRMVVAPYADRVVVLLDRGDVFWISGRRFYSGAVITPGRRGTLVNAMTWSLRGRALHPTGVGQLCWRPAAEAAPSACRPGHDFRIDVGTTRGLPRMYPQVLRLLSAGDRLTNTVGGRRVTVRQLQSDHRRSFTVSVGGRAYHATTPVDWPRRLSPRLVPGPGGSFGILFEEEGGDSMTMRLYQFRDGRLSVVALPGSPVLGDTFVQPDGRYVYSHTWQATSGRLFTTMADGPTPTGQAPQRLRTWAWQLRDGRLVATDLGMLCFNDSIDPPAVGRC